MAPPPRNRSGYDPTVYRQISTGSFVGLAAGLYVARFGKTLCWIFGALMLFIEVVPSLSPRFVSLCADNWGMCSGAGATGIRRVAAGQDQAVG